MIQEITITSSLTSIKSFSKVTMKQLVLPYVKVYQIMDVASEVYENSLLFLYYVLTINTFLKSL